MSKRKCLSISTILSLSLLVACSDDEGAVNDVGATGGSSERSEDGTGGEANGSGGSAQSGGSGGIGGSAGEQNMAGASATGGSEAACPEGEQDNDSNESCSPTCAAANLTCQEKSLCSDESGTAECVCETGYQDKDDNGSCEAACGSPGACGANTSCDDATGTVECSCANAMDVMGESGDCEPCTLGALTTDTPVSTSQLDFSGDFIPSCASPGERGSMNYTFSAPEAATYEFSTDGSGFDTIMSIHDGATCAGSELRCDDDSGLSTASKISLHLESGQTVVVAVHPYNSSASGNLQLQVSLIPE